MVAHRFSMPAADEVLPNSRNHGLKPSEDPFVIIFKCFKACKHIYSSSIKLTNLGYIRREQSRYEPNRKKVGHQIMILLV